MPPWLRRRFFRSCVIGRVVLHPVTIPEGLTITQIADVLAAQASRIVRSSSGWPRIGSSYVSWDLGRHGGRVSVSRHLSVSSPGQGARGLAGHGRAARAGDDQDRQARARIHLTLHEVLTLASVIEKETGSGDERPHISSVFHNRLKKRIPLQSDPTVIYGLPKFDGNLHKKDLSNPSPYNTYRGPGCRLGRLPIRAFSRSVPPCIRAVPLLLFCLEERRNASVFRDTRGT